MKSFPVIVIAQDTSSGEWYFSEGEQISDEGLTEWMAVAGTGRYADIRDQARAEGKRRNIPVLWHSCGSILVDQFARAI